MSSADLLLANSLASIVREAIPREYDKQKNWGHTKRITTGVTADGPIYKLKLHRRKKYVNHGTWKHYRVWLPKPEETAQDKKQEIPEEQLRVTVEKPTQSGDGRRRTTVDRRGRVGGLGANATLQPRHPPANAHRRGRLETTTGDRLRSADGG